MAIAHTPIMNRTRVSLVVVGLAWMGCAARKPEAVVPIQRPTTVAAPAIMVPDPTPMPMPSPTPAVPSEPRLPAPEKPIYYAFDSAQLRPESMEILREVAEYLRRNPGGALTISGHTCDIGTTEYNLALGGKRAAAAGEYLARLGIEAQRISTISYGEERPAVEGTDEASRSKNRRSEFAFQGSELRVGR